MDFGDNRDVRPAPLHMFASHMPICTLACSIRRLYDAYLDVIAAFSISEKRQLLHDTAARIYRL